MSNETRVFALSTAEAEDRSKTRFDRSVRVCGAIEEQKLGVLLHPAFCVDEGHPASDQCASFHKAAKLPQKTLPQEETKMEKKSTRTATACD